MASSRLLLVVMLSLLLFGCTNPLESRVTLSGDSLQVGSAFSATGVFDSKDCIFNSAPDFRSVDSFTIKDCQSKALANETVYHVRGSVCDKTTIDVGIKFGTLQSAEMMSFLLSGRSSLSQELLTDDEIDKDAEVWVEIPVVCPDAIDEKPFYQLIVDNYVLLDGAVKEQEVASRKSDLYCTGSTFIERDLSGTDGFIPEDIVDSPGYINSIGWSTGETGPTTIVYFNQETFNAASVSGNVKTDSLMVFSTPADSRLVGIPLTVDYDAPDQLSYMGTYLEMQNGSRIECTTEHLSRNYFAVCQIDSNASLADTSNALLLLYDYNRRLACYSRIPTQP